MSKTLVVSSVALVHALLIVGLAGLTSRQSSTAPPAQSYLTVRLIAQPSRKFAVPLTQTHLNLVPVRMNAPVLINFEDAYDADLSGIVGEASAPRLSRIQAVDIADFSRRAHISPGHPVTVVLAVEVGEDGFAGKVDVARSSGDAAADAVVIDYVLNLHWIPGTSNHKARAMRVMLPVTLM